MYENWKRNAAIFMTCQAVSIFGSSLVQFAITWYITLTTKSGIYATISIICGFLPTFFLTPFAGVWADRYPRKILIMVADGCIAVCTLVLAVVYMVGYREIWPLFAASVIRAFGSAVQNPCVGAILPDIVPEENLTKVNGLNGSIQSLIMLISPMLSGALLGMASMESIFFIDVVTAAAAITIMLLFLKVKERKKAQAEEEKDYLKELKAGYAYIGKHKYLKSFFLYLALLFFMAAPVAFLTPLQVTRNYGEAVWRLTAIEVVFSVGMLFGGLIIAAWEGFKNKILTIAVSSITMGIVTFVLGFHVHFWIYMAMMGAFGLAMPMLNTPAMTFLQERVEPEYLGRVFSIMTMITSSVMPLGMLVFGPVADIIKIEWLLLATGLFIVAMSVSIIKNKELVEAGIR